MVTNYAARRCDPPTVGATLPIPFRFASPLSIRLRGKAAMHRRRADETADLGATALAADI
jgi:hypothetical protein